MGDGLTHKYDVRRVDGKPVRWCFVLEDTDPLARVALVAYAEAARLAGYSELADGLLAKAETIPQPREPSMQSPRTWRSEARHPT